MNIQKMLEGLLGAGLSQQDIAVLTGVSQPTICRAHRGADVLYKSGKQIERLYQERLGSPMSKAA